MKQPESQDASHPPSHPPAPSPEFADNPWLDELPHIVWVADPDGGAVHFNHAGRDYMGADPAGADWSAWVHPEDGPVLGAAWTESRPYAVEARLRRRDGAYRWFRIVGKPLPDAGDGIAHWLGTCDDIHEYKQTEHALASKHALLATAPIGLACLDLELRYVQINSALADMNGLPVDAHLGRSVAEVLPELWPGLAPVLQRVLDNGEALVDLELSGETAAEPGITRHWLAGYFPLRVETALVGLGAAVLEITPFKRTEALLRESRDFKRAVLDSMEAQIAVLDRDGVIVEVNAPWHSSALARGSEPGRPAPRTGIGTNYLEVCRACQGPSSEHVLEAHDGIRAVLDGALPCFQLEYPCHIPDQEEWYSMKVTPLGPDIRGAVVAHSRITEYKRIEVKLAEQARQLREADRRKDEFIAMLAHELRNPLAPIGNALKIMGHTDGLPVRAAWCRGVVERQVEHLTRLIDDLLDVSRINHGRIELKREPLALQEVARQAVETSRPLFESRHQRFSLAAPREPIWIEGDRIRLAQVIANLLNNAAKYTGEGGRITLALEARPGHVDIRVRDTGCGIDPACLPNLFELFYQADHSLDRAQGGLGIGLSLVRRLVEMHGGEVRAFSAGRGRGSEFVVSLRRLYSVPVPSAAPLPGPSPAGLKKILIVDDNQDAAESLGLLLGLGGHRVWIAHDGPDALTMALAEPPEVVLLDIGLPGMDGYAVARAMRGSAGTDRPTIIALTGYGQPEDREKTRAAGFDAHLVKPVDLDTLNRLLGAADRGP
ncbi:hybrid sensor histidine kinase/response regulator [Methylomagnum ishizawai]|uniref:hybrid sensor histidine kinase/response regulator n=1 Tax=Methylomagnum ishizawai TaxID=1760988 RepID=UPI000F73FF67|nr:ATP-binding protein [Methylomagnum ishizawai]